VSSKVVVVSSSLASSEIAFAARMKLRDGESGRDIERRALTFPYWKLFINAWTLRSPSLAALRFLLMRRGAMSPAR